MNEFTTETVGQVTAVWRFPVKSLQGAPHDSLDVAADHIIGDREWGILEAESNRLLSAKRRKLLLEASADDDTITLPDGSAIAYDDADIDMRLSDWLGSAVTLKRRGGDTSVSYEMTFDPPNDDAELFEIPAPPGTFLDLAGVHLLDEATLRSAAATRPDLNWDVRRFRPNIVIDTGIDSAGFVAQEWVDREVTIGSCQLRVMMPTVRCAMPLRAQPGGIEREPDLFSAMSELNESHPNHLGIYLSIVRPGVVAVGDTVELVANSSKTGP